MAAAKPAPDLSNHVYDLNFGKVRMRIEMDEMDLTDTLKAQQAGLGLLGAMITSTAAKHKIKL